MAYRSFLTTDCKQSLGIGPQDLIVKEELLQQGDSVLLSMSTSSSSRSLIGDDNQETSL